MYFCKLKLREASFIHDLGKICNNVPPRQIIVKNLMKQKQASIQVYT